MKIHFWGATDDVTGSMTFLEGSAGNILIDCGLAQGTADTVAINDLPLPILPKNIKSVIITHAHLDHSGYLPRLVKKGFHGPIHCTLATAKLMRIILLDSAKLNEEFYDQKDVQKALNLMQVHDWHSQFDVNGIVTTFLPAGHILGASSVLLENEGKKILFSGDLGRIDDPILPACPSAPDVDIIVMESTYGGKNRTGDMEEELHDFLRKIKKEHRVGIIASFAVARAQTIMTLIHQIFENHPEEKIRVVMDGPMMKEANKVYQRYASLTRCEEALFEALGNIEVIQHASEWESLKKKSGPLVIISSSGMLSGGRIGRHLYNWRDDDKAILFLPGYQGEGTPGRSLLEGKRKLLDADENEFKWKGEVLSSSAFSSHADQSELLKWVGANKDAHIHLLHGEAGAKEQFKSKLQEKGFSHVQIPKRGQVI